jgi:DNA-binding cell septation regulator SpoVG
MVNINILNWKSYKNGGKVQGFFTVNFPDLELKINDCRLMKKDDGTLWVAYPSRTYEDNGERKYAPVVELYDKDIQKEIVDKVQEVSVPF